MQQNQYSYEDFIQKNLVNGLYTYVQNEVKIHHKKILKEINKNRGAQWLRHYLIWICIGKARVTYRYEVLVSEVIKIVYGI